MGIEARLQAKIIKLLKSEGFYVIKTRPGLGTPVGCPDVIFMRGKFWGAIEVKSSPSAKFQPLQKSTIEKMAGWSWCRVAYPENYEAITKEIKSLV